MTGENLQRQNHPEKIRESFLVLRAYPPPLPLPLHPACKASVKCKLDLFQPTLAPLTSCPCVGKTSVTASSWSWPGVRGPRESHQGSHTQFTGSHPDVLTCNKSPLVIVDEGAKISSSRTRTALFFFLNTSHFQTTEPDSALNKIVQTNVPRHLFSSCSPLSAARCLSTLPATCPVTPSWLSSTILSKVLADNDLMHSFKTAY